MAAPVETKVKAATAATFVVSIVLVVLNSVVADSTLLKPLPSWAQALSIAIAPAAVTFLSGWLAKHTPRTTPEG